MKEKTRLPQGRLLIKIWEISKRKFEKLTSNFVYEFTTYESHKKDFPIPISRAECKFRSWSLQTNQLSLTKFKERSPQQLLRTHSTFLCTRSARRVINANFSWDCLISNENLAFLAKKSVVLQISHFQWNSFSKKKWLLSFKIVCLQNSPHCALNHGSLVYYLGWC